MQILSGRNKRIGLAALLAAVLLLTSGCGAAVSRAAGTNQDGEISDADRTGDSTDPAAGVSSAETAEARTAGDANTLSTGEDALSAEDSTEDVLPSEGGAGEKSFLVVLDPGHTAQLPAGSEPIGPGAKEMKSKDTLGTMGVATGLHEYELNLQVCQKLQEELEERGYQVILTHDTNDTMISCSERAQVANENHADVFLRIHADGSENHSVNGATALCITKNNPYQPEEYAASYELSKLILQHYCMETGVQNRGVMLTDEMSGNNWCEVPCTLLEMGFMTNAAQDEWMASEVGQKEIVQAIADGLDAYRDQQTGSEPAVSAQTD